MQVYIQPELGILSFSEMLLFRSVSNVQMHSVHSFPLHVAVHSEGSHDQTCGVLCGQSGGPGGAVELPGDVAGPAVGPRGQQTAQTQVRIETTSFPCTL